MADLLDASAWLPLSAPDHVHHVRALRYWNEEASRELGFCRLTSLALLRHLSNPRIMGPATLDGRGAWLALESWLDHPDVVMLAEPPGLDEVLGSWSGLFSLRGGHWTDAYLAAFALAGGHRLVAFDSDFQRFTGLDFLHLAA